MNRMPWYLKITFIPLVPLLLMAGGLIVLVGQPGFGQQYIALPILLGLAVGRLFRVDDNREV